jgi:hypothetical protein
MSTTVTVTLVDLHRLDNTESGNPRWCLDVRVVASRPGVARVLTEPDSIVAHAITPDLVGRELTLTINDRHRVVDIGLKGET